MNCDKCNHEICEPEDKATICAVCSPLPSRPYVSNDFAHWYSNVTGYGTFQYEPPINDTFHNSRRKRRSDL